MSVKLMFLVILAATSYSASVTQQSLGSCSSGEFWCRNTGCISFKLVCDGLRDCVDGSDEFGCDKFKKEWSCLDGTCIPLRFRCDGNEDCDDGSDENVDACQKFQSLFKSTTTAPVLNESLLQSTSPRARECNTNEWMCWDGSCIPFRFRCDRWVDCADGSDENVANCQKILYMKSLGIVTRLAGAYQQSNHSTPEKLVRVGARASMVSPRQLNTCVLPDYPKLGTYNTNIPNAKPGDVYDSVTINVMCYNGYEVGGSSVVKCENGVWRAQMPKCVSQCYLSADADPSVEYRCLISGPGVVSRNCSTYEPIGTIVNPKCRSPYYYSPTPITYMRCNIHGTWDNYPKCIPECGTVTPEGSDLIVGGTSAKKAELPWHAGIYTKTTDPYSQICGGSLIAKNVIISAAHCFWNEKQGKLPAAEYAVAVGKLYRPWVDSMDEAQPSDVKELHMPEHFQGSVSHFQSDIAVMITKEYFKFNLFVRPVCLDFDINFERIQLRPGEMGKVAGWGLTSKNGNPSPVLQVVELPFISTGQCIQDSPLRFRPFISADKICAGYDKAGKAVCKGDSGGGLVFPTTEKGTTRYYLRGIVSTAPTNDVDTCNAFAYTSFTELQIHEHFIKDFWTADFQQYVSPGYFGSGGSSGGGVSNPSEERKICELPPYPDHGNYISNITDAKPGDVFLYVNVNITCEQGYGVSGPSFIYCLNGRWSGEKPKCVPICHLKPHPSVEYRCLVSESSKSFRSCKEYEITGTSVSPRCKHPYYYSMTDLSLMRCTDGNWNYVAKCLPVCGTVSTNITKFTTGAMQITKLTEVPWHAGIYKKNENQYTLICGGSLISNSVVLSALNCKWFCSSRPLLLTSPGSQTAPISNYAVAVGKLYRPWNDNRDDAQRSEVKAIHLPERYLGSAANFQADIAVVIVRRPFTYTEFIRPVCVDFNIKFEKRHFNSRISGKLASWPTGEDGNSSQVLQVVNMTYVSVSECISKSSMEFRQYITGDKICAGHNGNESVCIGDAGSGLAFTATEFKQNSQPRYYIRGILSLPPDNHKCISAKTFLTFTQILKHEHFIKQFWGMQTMMSKEKANCILPDYPAHGTYVTNIHDAKPGDGFDSVTINVTCEQGYEVDGFNTVYCYNGWWPEQLPTCVSQCLLKPDPSVEYRCLVSGVVDSYRICNEYEPSGTVASPQCRQPHYTSATSLPFMRCIEGNWDYIAKCSLECGLVTPDRTQIVNGGTSSAKRGEVPWHADIYTKTTDPYRKICGGSLISDSVVISAAHCFMSPANLTQEPATNFVVAVGKLFYLWEDSKEEAQRSDVLNVQLSDKHDSIARPYGIAVVTVIKPFELKTFIWPLCVNFDYYFEQRQRQQIGKVEVWDLTAASLQTLKVLDVSLIDLATCISDVGLELSNINPHTKFCEHISAFGLCTDDGGTGLAIPHTDGGTEKYYLRGVFTTATTFKNNCSVTALFSPMFEHQSFIQQFWSL